MKRREFLGLIYGVALALPDEAAAQQPSKVWRIGQVIVATPERGEILAKALEQGLVDVGYAQGRNIVLLTRFASPQPGKVEETILALVPKIDLLVVWSTMGGIAAKKVGSSVPTVFLSVGAPVEEGLVQSLAHPGGNMTGITFEASSETYGKRLQLLKEIIPDLKHVAVLGAVGDVNVGFAMTSFDRVAPGLGITFVSVDIRSAGDLEVAFGRMKESQVEAVIVIAGALTYTVGTRIADLALAAHLPSCFAFKEIVMAGGLISLGPDLVAFAGPAAAQIGKIIKGTSPADIPVEQPTRYELYINLKTAGLLNLTIPQSILGRADEVIE
jgi:putative tryptophan/tyrosine transport system substrate-binding protein